MPPTSTAETRALWASDDPAAWRAALAAYGARVAALNNDKLVELDEWYFEKLTKEIAKRDPKHMTSAELVKLVDWKLTRGKFRPRLLDFAKAHSAATVRDATAAAITLFPTAGIADLDDKHAGALVPLVALKGIGPATASAVLAAAFPSAVPFMSDEVMAVALPPSSSSDAYSTPRLLALAEAVRAKAANVGMTAGEVERAVYSEAALTKKPKAAPKVVPKKAQPSKPTKAAAEGEAEAETEAETEAVIKVSTVAAVSALPKKRKR